MYKFIFYGMYKSYTKSVTSKKKEDAIISAVWFMAALVFTNICTFFYLLEKIIGIRNYLLNEITSKSPILIIMILLLGAYNYFFCIKKLDVLAERYEPIFEKHKYLDNIVGFGYPILSFTLIALLVWLLGPL